MYGFKPRHAQGKPVQNLADGGTVHSLTGMLGMRKRTPEELRAADAKNQARNQEAATAAAGRAQAAPEPAAKAAPAKAISEYSSMYAMQRREKEQGLADGGAVKPRGFVVGKGTGTSDSIPARLSNGEYVLPADTVKAVGVEALDSLRAATHTPVKHEQAKAAHGFFAGGTPGGLDEEKLKNSFGDAAAVARDSSVAQVGGLANNGGADASRFAQVPAPIGTQPNRTQSPAAPTAQPTSTSGGLNAPWWSGEYATAARLSDKSGLELEQQRAAAATPSQAPADDPVKRIINTGTLSMPQAVTKPADAAPAAPAAPNPTDQRLAAGTQQAPTPAQQPSGNSPVGMSVADAQKQGLVGERVGYDPAYDQRLTGAPGQNGAVTRNGNSYAGTNVSGDITVNGQAPGGGAVSAQNMVAADALQARQTPAGFQPAGSQPAGVQAPVVRNSTNDWAARNNLRNLEVSASSITNQPGFSRGGRGYVPPDVAAYQAALQTDAALQQAQPGMDQTAMRENAGIQREGMQQQGATTRTGMQERGSMGRTMAQAALEQQKINQAGESQGFANRAAAQSEQLRNVLLDPKSTPEQRAVAQRNLAALSGKTAADRMQTVALPDTTNEMGQVVRGGQALVRVLEDGSVQQVPIGAQQGAALPPGMKRQIGTANGRPVYEDMNGKQVVAKG